MNILPSSLRSKQVMWIAAAVGALLVLGILIVGGVALIRRSSDQTALQTQPQSGGALPGSGEADTTFGLDSPEATQTLPDTTPEVSPSKSPVATTQNLALSVRYQRSDTFDLTIEAATYTDLDPTIADYTPNEGNDQFSVLRIYDSSNTVLGEYPISVGTAILLDGISGSDVGGRIEAVPQSLAYIVLPLTVDSTPFRAEITLQDGTVLDNKILTDITSFQVSSLLPDGLTLFSSILDFFRKPLAHAQGNDPCQALSPDPDNVRLRHFTIVVTNDIPNPIQPVDEDEEEHLQGLVDAAAVSIEAMISSLSPWSDYAACIDVRKSYNTQPMDCVVASNYPSCTNDQKVRSAAGGGNVTVVVNPNAGCNCGTVQLHLPSITVVGTGATPILMGHELGHATGKMTDEYLHQRGNTIPVVGPNCFTDQASCIQKGSDAGFNLSCVQGCDTVSSFRPSQNHLMNNNPINDYGPFETCILRNKLLRIIGPIDPLNDACEGAGGRSRPAPGGNPPGPYFGWHR